MRVQAVIDRFEGNKAVLLVGTEEVQVIWPREHIPTDSKEGYILQIKLNFDEIATAKAQAEGERLLKELVGNQQ